MAILRGGRRIGNFDIRLGLPRDKSLVDITKDPRLQRKPGGAGTIQRFLAQVNQGEGFSKNNRFIVRINLPRPIGSLTNKKGVNDLESNQIVENIDMMCNKVTLPNRDIATAPHQVYGPRREMPYAYQYSAQIECTFYGDKFLRQRMFFENWQKKILDLNSHNMSFYDDYVGSMDIYQLGQFDVATEESKRQGPRTFKVPKAQIDNASVTYGVRLFEVYPQTIGSIDFDYSADAVTNVPITLNFRTWANLTIDQVNGATIGKTEGDVPTIKASKDFGLFSGILGKLPPEFQRAGRNILQTTRRNLPIGRITGGRVFPPFG
tara:strand:- start:49 stop:1008 length:960 start_codon:yes stop_codon:yes gene_type:complete